jgi:two-component system sensor histidine kinase AtoS
MMDLKSKVEDGVLTHVPSEYSMVDVNDIIDDIFFYMQLKMALNGITPICDLCSGLSKLRGDREDLHDLFVGLIGQSIEAMKKGGVLSVSTFQGVDHISVIICDEAVDVSEETKRFIYDPTFKISDITCGETLGIAIMLDIIKRHNGFFNINTLKTRGRQFEIFFPVKEHEKRSGFENKTAKQFTN